MSFVTAPCLFPESCRRFAQRLGLAVLGAMPLAGCGGGSGSVHSALTTPVTTPATTSGTANTTTIPITSVPVTAGTKINATVNKPTAQVGQSILLTAALTDTHGTAVAGKKVTFTLGDTAIGSDTTTSGGQAALAYTLPQTLLPQTYTITARFAGDSEFPASQGYASVTVALAATALTLNLDTPRAQPGQSVTLTAALTTNGAVLGGKTVAFAVDKTPIGTAMTDGGGKATLTYVIPTGTPIGTRALTATFADTGYVSSSASAAISVTPILTLTPNTVTTSVRYFTVGITARLTNTDGSPIAGKKLTVPLYFSGGTAIGEGTTDATGAANMTIRINILTGASPGFVLIPPLKPGTYQLPVIFAGDATYPATWAYLSVVVKV